MRTAQINWNKNHVDGIKNNSENLLGFCDLHSGDVNGSCENTKYSSLYDLGEKMVKSRSNIELSISSNDFYDTKHLLLELIENFSIETLIKLKFEK